MSSALALLSVSNQSSIKSCILCNQKNHKCHQCKIVSKPEVQKGIILSKNFGCICLKAVHIAKICRSIFNSLNIKSDTMLVFARLKMLVLVVINSSGNSFTQIDKQNDGKKETTAASQNIASVHPSLNLYHVSSVLLQTTQGRSSLIYNTSSRHLQHQCNTSVTLATQMQHEWDTREMSATQVWHECYTNATSVTRVKNFNFDNDTCKNIFTLLYLLHGKWKTTRRGTISFQELPFGNASFPCQKAFKWCTTKTKLFNGKNYV